MSDLWAWGCGRSRYVQPWGLPGRSQPAGPAGWRDGDRGRRCSLWGRGSFQPLRPPAQSPGQGTRRCCQLLQGHGDGRSLPAPTEPWGLGRSDSPDAAPPLPLGLSSWCHDAGAGLGQRSPTLGRHGAKATRWLPQVLAAPFAGRSGKRGCAQPLPLLLPHPPGSRSLGRLSLAPLGWVCPCLQFRPATLARSY